MINSIRNIYANKLILGQRDDFNKLIDCINEFNPNLIISDNYNRTLLIKLKDNQFDTNEFERAFAYGLDKWLGQGSITCGLHHIYDIMPLDQEKLLLRI